MATVPNFCFICHRPTIIQDMERLQAYKFELQPKPGQAIAFRCVAGCCRLVFNRALAEQKARHERAEKHLGYGDLCKELTAWKREEETAFLGEAHSQPLQQALKDLGRPTPISLRVERRTLASRSVASATASATHSRSRNILTRPTAGSSCPRLVGFATATAGPSRAHRRTLR